MVLVGLFAYLAIGLASPWLGYWWFVAFTSLSILTATILAALNREYWPVVHPAYSLFYVLPALLAGFTLVFVHPVEWGQWIAWSLGLTLVVMAALTLTNRRYINREWSVVGTSFIVFVLAAFALDSANSALGQQACRSQLVGVVHASPGGYRQGGPRVTVSSAQPEEKTFSVSYDVYRAADDGAALCVREYNGALGWQWSRLARCTAAESTPRSAMAS